MTDNSRRVRIALAAILAVAFALRVAYVLQSRASPLFDAPQMDALYHVEWAREFAAGREFQPGPFFRAPLYPWFLGAVLALFGDGLLAPRLVQAAIGTASVALVYLIGARAFDRRVGLFAAAMAASNWVQIYFEGELLLPVLEVFLDLAAILASLRAGERPTRGRVALAGLAWGVAALVRPNVLLFAPLVLAWVAWRAGAPWRARIGATATFALAFAAPIAPITAYNRIAGGDWVLIASQGGLNFWIGNNPTSDGASAVVPGARLDWWGGYHDSIAMAQAEAGRELKPSEVSQHYFDKAWIWMRANPGAAWRLWLWKLRLFWTDWELGNNSSESFFALRYGPILRWLPIGFGLLAPLALLGFFLCGRRGAGLFPLWGFLPVYMVSVVAFFVCSKFRVPVLPVMAVLAAHACTWSYDAIRARRFAAFAAAALFAGSAFAFVRSVPAAIDRSDAGGWAQLGAIALERGDAVQAAEHLERALDVSSRSESRPRLLLATVHRQLGIALRRQSKLDEAERHLREAIVLDPANVEAMGQLVDLLIEARRRDEAKAIAREAAARSSVYAPARYDLGRIADADADDLAKAGAGAGSVSAKLEEALREFRACSALATDETSAFNCAFGAGYALIKLGRPSEARPELERALAARSQPDAEGWWWSCQRLVLEVLRAEGRADEARTRAEVLLRRFPNDPRARDLAAEFARARN